MLEIKVVITKLDDDYKPGDQVCFIGMLRKEDIEASNGMVFEFEMERITQEFLPYLNPMGELIKGLPVEYQ